jgi:predicted glycosyltransferase
MISLASEQIVEIGDALASYPLIWSLKAKSQIHLTSSFKESQSHMILDWAPQCLILHHPAVRLFVSHGGWNSVLDVMSAGKPVLAWPKFCDQFLNAQLLERKLNIGRMIKNTKIGNDQRILSADEIKNYVNEIFAQEKIYVEKAKLIKQIVYDAKENSSRQHFEEILNIDKEKPIKSKKDSYSYKTFFKERYF